MSNLLPLFPNSPSGLAPSNSVGEDLLAALLDMQQDEVALRKSLVDDSWEADYHAGKRVELAGAAFFVLTSLPLDTTPATFIASTKTHLSEHLEKLQAGLQIPYTGRAHGQFDAITELIEHLDRLLDLRIDSLSL